MTVDTKELRRLAQAATPGPWYVGSGIYEGRNIYSVVSVTDAEGFTYQPVVATVEDNDTQLWSENTSFIAAANPAAINELLSRLEAAESDALEQARLNGMGSEREAALMAKLEEAEENRSHFLVKIGKLYAQCDALHAKIDAMEKQEPVAFGLYSGWALKATYLKEHEACEQRDRRQLTADLGGSLEAYHVSPLYALPGAKGEQK